MGLYAEKATKKGKEESEKLSNHYSNAFKNLGVNLGNSLGSAITNSLRATTTAITSVSVGIAGLGAGIIKVGSEFEAQMSKVQAVSGATTDEIQALTEKAKEMGASTQFSATESAQALEYMALAGWKTEDMLGGLSGVMNLASASGEDLGLVSDILTDGLTAFGLSAQESGRFADVLASASSNANTNVAMLGESFKYVAPLSGALGYSVEDTAVALGLMANAGIKASNSGTALRSILSNLTSPTDTVAKAMRELNISVQDSKGEMLPLNEVMKNLRDSFSGLNEAEQAQYASMIAGKEAMSGLLAIVNASEEDFNKLTSAINNSNGVAEQMAITMNDNLAGAIKLFNSALQGLGISIYENLQEPLKEITKEATNVLNNLQKAFDKGGLEGLISALGTELANVINSLAEQAPQFIQLATQLILSFLDGINQNSEQLGQAGAQILMSLIIGIFEILPQFVQTATDLIINFQEGLIENLPTLLQSGKQMLENLANGITENLPIILQNSIEILMQLVNGLIDNLPLIIDTGIEILLALVDSLIDTAPELIPATVKIILTIVEELINNLDKIIDAGIELILALAFGIIDSIPIILEKIPVIISKIVIELTKPSTQLKLIDAGIQLILALIKGIFKMNLAIVEAGWNILKELINSIKDPKEMIEAGKDLIRGLISGIKSMASEMYNTMKNFASGIIKDVKGFFGIHSPSKVFEEEIGIWLPLGMANGISSKAKEVVEALVNPVEQAQEEIKIQGNVFTENLTDIISNATDEAKKEAKNYSEVGKILIESISRNIKKNVDNVLTPLTEEIEKNLNQNIEVVEKNAEELINAYTEKIQAEAEAKKEKIDIAIENLSKEAPKTIKNQLQKDKKAIDENAKQLIKTYSDGVKKSAETEKNELKKTTDGLLNVLTTNFEQGVQQVNEILNVKIGGLAETYESKFDSLVKAQENLSNKLADSNLFSFEEENLVVENLEETINTLQKYDEAITQLKEKGISDAILNELAGYDTEEVLKISEELLRMTDTEFQKLNDKWEEKQELATKVASNFYKQQMETLEKDFNDELIKTLNELPTQVENIGEMAITGFQNGLESRMSSILENVENFAESVVEQMKKALDIHSPSRKMQWIGNMTMDGYEKGVKENVKPTLQTIADIPILDTFKEQIAKTRAIVSMSVNSMIPKSSQISNISSTNNVTNNQGDFIINVNGLKNDNSNDIQVFLQQAEFYRKTRATAIGGV